MNKVTPNKKIGRRLSAINLVMLALYLGVLTWLGMYIGMSCESIGLCRQ